MENTIIIDTIADTIEEEFSGLYCECKHLLSGHIAGKCYFFGRENDMFVGCDCTNKVPLQFKVKVHVEDAISDVRTDNSSEKVA